MAHPSQHFTSHSPEHERLLIEEQDNARRRALEEEERAQRPRATYWLKSPLLEISEESLGPGHHSPRPLDVLADRWTRPNSRISRRASSNFLRSVSTSPSYPNGTVWQGQVEYLNPDHHDCAREINQLRADRDRLTAEVDAVNMHRSKDAAFISGLQNAFHALDQKCFSLQREKDSLAHECSNLQRLVDALEQGRYRLRSERDQLKIAHVYLRRQVGEPPKMSYNRPRKDFRVPDGRHR